MCCKDAQAEASRRISAAEAVMREHGLYRVDADEQATAVWAAAKQRFDEALRLHEELTRTCCS